MLMSHFHVASFYEFWSFYSYAYDIVFLTLRSFTLFPNKTSKTCKTIHAS